MFKRKAYAIIKRHLVHLSGALSRIVCFLFLDGDGNETLCARSYQLEIDNKSTLASRTLSRIINHYDPHHTKAMWILYRRSLKHEPPRDE